MTTNPPEDPWEALRHSREVDAEVQRGEHADKRSLTDRIPLYKVFLAWFKVEVLGWFKRQLPRASRVPHSDYYLAFPAPTPRRKGKPRPAPIPLVIGGLRVSRWAAILGVLLVAVLFNVLV